jgi:putative two-component system response regulator
MKILAVDDDELARSVLTHALVQAGHEPLVARDGQEALAILRQDACRMVISDWVMPGMDGVELCRRIRAAEFPGYVYVILLTSRDDIQDVVEGLTAGADDFMTKPFHPAELRVRIRVGERILSLETREVAIFALAKLAESRDPETGEHLERMRNYARILAQHLATTPQHAGAVDDEFIRLIYLTSPLHDIGKVGIPDSVLLKPGRLSNREFEIMKQHALIGAETLEAAARQYPGVAYLRMARDIAAGHHERFDGSGYPEGRAGEDTPLSARIVALADVYDALTSKRVYKPAFAPDIARSMIVGESGKHFDPALVEAFVAEEDRFLAVREQFAEQQMALV